MYMSEICIIVTIIVYLAAMLLVGFAYSKTNNDSADFYLGGRKMRLRWMGKLMHSPMIMATM